MTLPRPLESEAPLCEDKCYGLAFKSTCTPATIQTLLFDCAGCPREYILRFSAGCTSASARTDEPVRWIVGLVFAALLPVALIASVMWGVRRRRRRLQHAGEEREREKQGVWGWEGTRDDADSELYGVEEARQGKRWSWVEDGRSCEIGAPVGAVIRPEK